MTSDPASFPPADPRDDLFGPPGTAAAVPPGSRLADDEETGVPKDMDRGGPEPMYHAVEDWVIDHFLPMFRRTLGGEFRWCAHWWKHDEAVSRLTALWHAWEVLRQQPGTGMATWYRDHLDHQLPILMGARGPFYQCSETTHREPRETAVVIAPGDVWDGDGGIAVPDGGLPPVTRNAGAGDDRG